MEYEVVIGLEVHVQLKTRTKIFSSAPYSFAQEPNTLTDPVVLGLPGTLPVLNIEAVRQCALMGVLFDCEIAKRCKWDRKNYFYPDNPKNYQISQYDQPLCIGGQVEIELPGPSRNVMGEHKHIRLTRIHLEEDPAKLNHGGTDSLVDYNRSGVALAEIVTDPDLRSSDECVAFLNALRMNLANAGVSDCDMEKGQMRCDANVSLRPKGSEVLGTRSETKNLNSVSAVKAAVESEIRRQKKILDKGELVVQETRRWDMEEGKSYTLRTKEEAHDYRYFPDPDLMPVELGDDFIADLKTRKPEPVFTRQERFFKKYDLPYTVTSVLCPVRELADFFEAAAKDCKNPQMVANLVANDLLRELSAGSETGSLSLSESKITPAMLAELVTLVDAKTISKQIARDVFIEMFQSGEMPAAIVERKGLKQTSDTGQLEELCKEAMAQNEKAVQQVREGKDKAINAMKGYVMKQTKGSADPQLVDEILRKLILG